MDGFAFATLVVVGFTAGAEFGSYAFVHPVVRRLPAQHHIAVEQGLLRTFGRVMPVLMPLSLILAVVCAIRLGGDDGAAGAAAWAAVAAIGLAVLSTLTFNVPLNAATSRWDAANPPSDWQRTRGRWEFFQGLRSWLLLAGFVLLCLATAGQL